jgi:hypothetical protein
MFKAMYNYEINYRGKEDTMIFDLIFAKRK